MIIRCLLQPYKRLVPYRYLDVIPYTSCLISPSIPQFPTLNAYINASLVQEPQITTSSGLPRYWIATQGPKPETIFDFYSLFISTPKLYASDHSPILTPPTMIVQLTGIVEAGVVKCGAYLPDSTDLPAIFPARNFTDLGQPIQEEPHAFIEVRMMSRVEDATSRPWIETKLSVQLLDQDKVTVGLPKIIDHLEFLDWRDHDVPEDSKSVISFINRIQQLHSESTDSISTKPIVAHCSAGIGRTGTLIAASALLSQLPPASHSLTKYASIPSIPLATDGSNPLFSIPISPRLPPHISTYEGLSPLRPENKSGSSFKSVKLENREKVCCRDPVFQVVDLLREQRTGSVQTPSQFQLLYEVVKNGVSGLA
jgi:protein tyrosine phosphatase